MAEIPKDVLQDDLITVMRENADLRVRVAELEAALKEINNAELNGKGRFTVMAIVDRALERDRTDWMAQKVVTVGTALSEAGRRDA